MRRSLFSYFQISHPVQVESPQNFHGQQLVSQNLSISAILIGQNVHDVTEKDFIPAILSSSFEHFANVGYFDQESMAASKISLDKDAFFRRIKRIYDAWKVKIL